jgi:hypothetical protein
MFPAQRSLPRPHPRISAALLAFAPGLRSHQDRLRSQLCTDLYGLASGPAGTPCLLRLMITLARGHKKGTDFIECKVDRMWWSRERGTSIRRYYNNGRGHSVRIVWSRWACGTARKDGHGTLAAGPMARSCRPSCSSSLQCWASASSTTDPPGGQWQHSDFLLCSQAIDISAVPPLARSENTLQCAAPVLAGCTC